MGTRPRKLPFVLRSKGKYMAVSTAFFAGMGLLTVVAAQLHYSGTIRALESFFGFATGAVGGFIWSHFMWTLFVQPRIKEIDHGASHR